MTTKTLFDPDLTLDAAKELIENGADLDLQNKNGSTPLFYVLDYDVFKLLIDNGANVDIVNEYGETPLFYVRNVAMLQLFIEHGIDINAKDENGLSFIFYTNDIDILKFSIEHGLDINNIDNVFGMTVLDDQNSLYNRSSKDNINNAKLLITHGAISGKIETYKKYQHCFTQKQQEVFDAFASIANNDDDFFHMCLTYQNDQKNKIEIEIKDMEIL